MVSTKTRMMAALAIPAALMLSACKVDSEVVVTDKDHINLIIAFDTEQSNPDATCDKVVEAAGDSLDVFVSSRSVETLEDAEGLGCKITLEFNKTFRQNIYSSDKGGHSIEFPSYFWDGFATGFGRSKEATDLLNSSAISMSITLPDEIKEVTEGGSIDGNTATWDGYSAISKGVGASTVDGFVFRGVFPGSTTFPPQSTSLPSSKVTELPTLTKKKETTDSEGGPSIRVWVSIAAVALIIGGGILFGIIRSKGRKDGNAQFGPNQPFGQQAGQPFNQPLQGQSFGQPAQGQPFGQTGQGQPYGHTGQPYGQPTQEFGQTPGQTQPYGYQAPQQFNQTPGAPENPAN